MPKIPIDTAYNAWIEDSDVYFNFYELEKVYGPFKIYVEEGNYVVPPESIYQSYPQGGKYAQIKFPLSLVGNQTVFNFKAVTVTAEEEKFLVAGIFPLPLSKGKGND